jgi:hypothetical protein
MSSQPIIHEHLTVTPLGEHPDALDAAMSGTDDGILRIALRRPLEEGSIVRIAAGQKYSTTGRVLYSLPYDGLHYATISVPENGGRKEARIKVDEAAHVVSLEPHAPIDCHAWVADVSKSGIGLITSVYMTRDLLLKIVLGSAIVFGEVRHCSAMATDQGSFKVGVEIQTVIFRDEKEPSNWLITPKVLWATLSVGFQSLVARVRRSSATESD